MKCPYCGGEFEAVNLLTQTASSVVGYHCTQCGGFWFERLPAESFEPSSLARYDSPQQNYNLKAFNLACPIDGTMLSEDDSNQADGRRWLCPDCRGVFYPKGQLALSAEAMSAQAPNHSGGTLGSRAQVATALSLVGGLAVLVLGTLNKTTASLSAAGTSPLPTSGPNILTLVLLAVTYLAGTVLAVLGRRLPIIIMGWGVIAVCLFGFSVLIFGP